MRRSNMTNPTRRPVRRGERGVALALALFAMAAMMVGAASALYVGGDNLQAARNYESAVQTHFVAESALSRAVQNINYVNTVGVSNIKTQVVDVWSSNANLLGPSSKQFAQAGYSFKVAAIADGTNPSQLGWLRATATGPENASN